MEEKTTFHPLPKWAVEDFERRQKAALAALEKSVNRSESQRRYHGTKDRITKEERQRWEKSRKWTEYLYKTFPGCPGCGVSRDDWRCRGKRGTGKRLNICCSSKCAGIYRQANMPMEYLKSLMNRVDAVFDEWIAARRNVKRGL